MLKNKTLEKVLAIILIFTLTSANFAFVSKAYASSFTEVLFGEKSDTGSKNVGFEAYFETEDEKVTSVISDVNNKDIAISMDLSVNNSGYLKDAEISVKEIEESGLNFNIKPIEELSDYVQCLEDNTLKLYQVDSYNEEISLKLPIEFKNEKYFDESNLSKEFLVILKGIYVDNQGVEKEIYKEVPLTISWKDERQVSVKSEIEKYVDFGEGVIVQTRVHVDNYTEENSLPVRETEITIAVPEFQEVVPSNITVEANSTEGTNGETVGEAKFSDDNWEYNEEERTLTIKVTNEKQSVVVNEFENELLQDAEQDLVEEERLYNIPGSDDFLITYTYNNVEIPEEDVQIDSNVEAKTTLFSGDENDNNIIITNEDNHEDVLGAITGEIVSLSIENVTKEISKAYFYANLKDSKNEIELDSKTLINVSHADIVDSIELEDIDSSYVKNNGEKITTDDVYYKEISISKENFVKMLGENGEITVNNINDELITTIRMNQNDDENIVANIDGNNSKLKIATTKPVSEGNLIINTKKAIKGISIDKETVQSVESVLSSMSLKASYGESEIEPSIIESQIDLKNTETKANLSMNRDNLSTLTLNEGVELRISLNNATEESDLYGYSEFEIELPEYIDEINVKDNLAKVLLNDEEKEADVQVDGRTLKFALDLNQTEVKTGSFENGTIIVLTADIKVNLFTPTKSDKIILRVNNSEATNYINNGEYELEFIYSAPSGLVVANSTYNYNNSGDIIASVNQGLKIGSLDVYSSSKVATMELVVMNNNTNNVSDLIILGRFPFEGVKDIANENNLETTLTPKILSGIKQNENNNTGFTIYYSPKEDATRELNNLENEWSSELSLDQAKSYLIVPTDENYLMEPQTVLKFTYDYEIPENLPRNNNIYGTFVAYYINLSEDELLSVREAYADLVGVSTGSGPEVSLEVLPNKEKVKELGELQLKLLVKNIGKEKAENIEIKLDVPNGTEYTDYLPKDENIEVVEENGIIKVSIAELEISTESEVDILLKAKKFIGSNTTATIETKATITAKDLGAVLEAESKTVVIEEADFEISETAQVGAKRVEIYREGDTVEYTVYLRNVRNDDLTGTIATKTVPEGIEFTRAYSIINGEEVEANYNKSANMVTWNIDKLGSSKMVLLKLNGIVDALDEKLSEKTIITNTSVTANEIDSAYESNIVQIKVGKPELKISQETDTTNTYVKEGSTINYKFVIKNQGSAKAENILFTEVIPDGLNVKSINYEIGEVKASTSAKTKTETVVKAVTLESGMDMVVNVKAIAANLNGVQEKTVTNYATVSADGISAIKSTAITHIIEASEKNEISNDIEKSTSQTRVNSSSNITKTYRLSGVAWLDSNKNGMRDEEEELLPGITVRLINSDNNIIQKTITTDVAGTYTFTGVENGNYYVVFEYNTVKYAVTTYQQSGVADNVNSDVISTKFTQNGKTVNAATTNIVKVFNGSVSGIDLGLVLADVFDLKVDKTITKVTVQTQAGTTTEKYDNLKIVKSEIAAKNLAGATVYVEYEIKVTNIGDIAGYAKKVVDYLPSGMNFSSTLGEDNANWYTGSNGDLYTEVFANKELAKGESASIKLVLTRSMTPENTDIVNNNAEIYEDYNIYGVSDTNSVVANKAQGENDLSAADIAIMVKTGETFLNISVISMTVLLVVIVAFVVYGKIKEIIRRREGV